MVLGLRRLRTKLWCALPSSIRQSLLGRKLETLDGELPPLIHHSLEALLDFAKLGYATRATVILKVSRDQREAVREYLMRNANVNNLMKINNDFDFLFEAVFREIRDLEAFMERLEEEFKVRTAKVFYVIEDLKREGFLSDPMQVETPGEVGSDSG